jgi:hypothetical protein
MKIHSVVPELLHADGQIDRQTDMTELKGTVIKLVVANVPERKNEAFFLGRRGLPLIYCKLH